MALASEDDAPGASPCDVVVLDVPSMYEPQSQFRVVPISPCIVIPVLTNGRVMLMSVLTDPCLV